MYGHYRFSIDLDESIEHVAQILSSIKGQPFPRETTRIACAHYKQLALVCACAFMMLPMAHALKDPRKQTNVRRCLSQQVDSIYPIFATQSPVWDYQEIMATVTELALCFTQSIIAMNPTLIYALGMPNMYVFVPTHIGVGEDPHMQEFDGMNRVQRWNALRNLDQARSNALVAEPDNRLTFTLWVRQPPQARLLTHGGF